MTLDETTIERVLTAERRKLVAYIWSIVRDAHRAEDVFQQVAVLALQRRGELRDPGALPVWLRRAARFQALASLRDGSRDPLQVLSPEVLDQLDAFWAAEDDRGDDERLAAMRDCMQRLSPYARQVVTLRYGKGMSGGEVADALGRNVRTIYMALTRVHNALRECIEERLAAEGGTHD